MFEQVRYDHARGQRIHTQPWWARGAGVSIGAVNALFGGIKVVSGQLRARREEDGTPRLMGIQRRQGNQRYGFFPVEIDANDIRGKHFRRETLLGLGRLIDLTDEEARYFDLMVQAHCTRHAEQRRKIVERLYDIRRRRADSLASARTVCAASWIAQTLALCLELPGAPSDPAEVPTWFVQQLMFPVDVAEVERVFALMRAQGMISQKPGEGWRRCQRAMVIDVQEVRRNKELWDNYARGLLDFAHLAEGTFDDWEKTAPDGWRRRNCWTNANRWVHGLMAVIPAERFAAVRDMLEDVLEKVSLANDPHQGNMVVRLNVQLFAMNKVPLPPTSAELSAASRNGPNAADAAPTTRPGLRRPPKIHRKADSVPVGAEPDVAVSEMPPLGNPLRDLVGKGPGERGRKPPKVERTPRQRRKSTTVAARRPNSTTAPGRVGRLHKTTDTPTQDSRSSRSPQSASTTAIRRKALKKIRKIDKEASR